MLCLWSSIYRFLTSQKRCIIPEWAWGCRDCVGAGIVADLTEFRSTSAVILGLVREKSIHWATVSKWSYRREVVLWHRLVAAHLLQAKLIAFAVRIEWWCARCNSLHGFCIPWSCVSSGRWSVVNVAALASERSGVSGRSILWFLCFNCLFLSYTLSIYIHLLIVCYDPEPWFPVLTKEDKKNYFLPKFWQKRGCFFLRDEKDMANDTRTLAIVILPNYYK